MAPLSLGIPSGKTFPDKNFLLVRRELDKSIFQAVLSKNVFFQNLGNFLGPGQPGPAGRPTQIKACLLVVPSLIVPHPGGEGGL